MIWHLLLYFQYGSYRVIETTILGWLLQQLRHRHHCWDGSAGTLARLPREGGRPRSAWHHEELWGEMVRMVVTSYPSSQWSLVVLYSSLLFVCTLLWIYKLFSIYCIPMRIVWCKNRCGQLLCVHIEPEIWFNILQYLDCKVCTFINHYICSYSLLLLLENFTLLRPDYN